MLPALTEKKLDLQDGLLEKPTFVRLKFLGTGVPGGKPAPPRNSVRDVQVRTLEDIAGHVEDWLGAPGSWQLTTAANWPLTLEAIRRPTSSRCPLVVNIQNTQEVLLAKLDQIAKRHTKVEENLGKMQSDRMKEAKEYNKRMQLLQAEVDKLGTLNELHNRVQARPLKNRLSQCHDCLVQPFVRNFCFVLCLLGLILLVCFWFVKIESQVVDQNSATSKRMERSEDQVHNLSERIKKVKLSLPDHLKELPDEVQALKQEMQRLNRTLRDDLRREMASVLKKQNEKLQAARDELQKQEVQGRRSVDEIKRLEAREATELERLNETWREEEVHEVREVKKVADTAVQTSADVAASVRKADRALRKVFQLNHSVQESLHQAEATAKKVVLEAKRQEDALEQHREEAHMNETARGLKNLQKEVDDMRQELKCLRNESNHLASKAHDSDSMLRDELDDLKRDVAANYSHIHENFDRLADYAQRKASSARSEIGDVKRALANLSDSARDAFDDFKEKTHQASGDRERLEKRVGDLEGQISRIRISTVTKVQQNRSVREIEADIQMIKGNLTQEGRNASSASQKERQEEKAFSEEVRHRLSENERDEDEHFKEQVKELKAQAAKLDEREDQLQALNASFDSEKHKVSGELHDIEERMRHILKAARRDFHCAICKSCGGHYPYAMGIRLGENTSICPGKDCYGETCADDAGDDDADISDPTAEEVDSIGSGPARTPSMMASSATAPSQHGYICCRRGLFEATNDLVALSDRLPDVMLM